MMTDSQPGLPLEGVLVLDVSRVLSGPYSTFLLAQLGARVIKVELPEVGDDARGFGPFVDGVSGYFASVNRGKESIALDLKATGDREIFEALLARADVLVENFRPQVMDRLGYGWHAVRRKYARLIYGSVSGFGKSDSPGDMPAYDIIIQALSGIMSVTGKRKGDFNRVGVSIGDLSSGLFLTIGILACLIRRQRTGAGDVIDIAMLDSVLSLMEYPVMRHAVDGVPPGPIGTYRPAIPPPFGLYQARDRTIVIAAGNDRLFEAVCRALPLGPEFRRIYADAEVRKDNEDVIARKMNETLSGVDAAKWIDILRANGVPCALVNDVGDAVALAGATGRRILEDRISPAGRPYFLANSPVQFPFASRREDCGTIPGFDEHRQQILAMIRQGHPETNPS